VAAEPGSEGSATREIGQVAWHEVQPLVPPPRIDINNADVRELIRLPGVGRRAAKRIVGEREANGPFQSIADLERVHGFDEHRVRRLWERAKV
jgi:competence protein ComEA